MSSEADIDVELLKSEIKKTSFLWGTSGAQLVAIICCARRSATYEAPLERGPGSAVPSTAD